MGKLYGGLSNQEGAFSVSMKWLQYRHGLPFTLFTYTIEKKKFKV